MFPTQPIQDYINLSFAKKTVELAKDHAREINKSRLNTAANSGLYYHALMLADVRHRQSKIGAWIEIVREACRDANRPVDDEVRNYILAEVHVMCDAAKKQTVDSVTLQLKQGGMSSIPRLQEALLSEADRRISAIESGIARDFKLEELREGIRKSVEVAKPVEAPKPAEALSPVPIPAPAIAQADPAPKSKLTTGDRIDLWIGIPLIVIGLLTLAAMFLIPKLEKPPGPNPVKPVPTVLAPTPTSPVEKPTPSRGSQPSNGARRRRPPHPTPCTMKEGTFYPTPLDLPGGKDLKRPTFELEGVHLQALSWENDQYLLLNELSLTNRGEDSIVKDWEVCLVVDGKPLTFKPGPIPKEGVLLQTGEKITNDQTLTEKAIREPIKHGGVLTGWVAFSVPKELALRLMSAPKMPDGAFRFKDYLAHTYSIDFVGLTGEAPKTAPYIPGKN